MASSPLSAVDSRPDCRLDTCSKFADKVTAILASRDHVVARALDDAGDAADQTRSLLTATLLLARLSAPLVRQHHQSILQSYLAWCGTAPTLEDHPTPRLRHSWSGSGSACDSEEDSEDEDDADSDDGTETDPYPAFPLSPSLLMLYFASTPLGKDPPRCRAVLKSLKWINSRLSVLLEWPAPLAAEESNDGWEWDTLDGFGQGEWLAWVQAKAAEPLLVEERWKPIAVVDAASEKDDHRGRAAEKVVQIVENAKRGQATPPPTLAKSADLLHYHHPHHPLRQQQEQHLHFLRHQHQQHHQHQHQVYPSSVPPPQFQASQDTSPASSNSFSITPVSDAEAGSSTSSVHIQALQQQYSRHPATTIKEAEADSAEAQEHEARLRMLGNQPRAFGSYSSACSMTTADSRQTDFDRILTPLNLDVRPFSSSSSSRDSSRSGRKGDESRDFSCPSSYDEPSELELKARKDSSVRRPGVLPTTGPMADEWSKTFRERQQEPTVMGESITKGFGMGPEEEDWTWS